jgi:hypothetical protein
MPTYVIGGKRVTTPQPLTDEQIDEIAMDMGLIQPPKPSQQPTPAPQPSMPVVSGAEEFSSVENVQMQQPSGFMRGATYDPVAALVQFTGKDARQRLAQQEQQYQQERAARGETGFEPSRLAGNILSPVNIIPGAAAARVANVGRAGQAAIGGATGALTAPTEGAISAGDFFKEKLEQTVFGAGAGYGVYKLGSKVGSKLFPPVKEGVDELLNAGVPVTPGQAYQGVPGWFFKQIESFDIPFYRVNKDKLNTQFTKAVGNEVLSSIGAKVPKEAQTGEEIFAAVHGSIKQAYTKAVNSIPPTNATDLVQNVDNVIQQTTPQLSNTRQAKAFQNIINANVLNKVKNGEISGTELKEIESFLRKKSNSIKGFDVDADTLRTGYDEALKVVKGFIQEVDPTGQVKAANEAYLKRARLQSAIAKSQTDAPGQRGTITPRRLMEAVKSQAGEGQVALGQAPMQQTAARAFDIIGESAEEATKYRNILIAGKLTGLGVYGLFQPQIAIPLFLASGVSYDVANMLLKSPNARAAMNQAIEKLGPAAVGRIVAESKQEPFTIDVTTRNQ